MRTTESTVGIAVLLPDLLGTYADTGNALVLAQRMRWRGIECRIHPVTTSVAPPTGCELYLLGGGEDTAQRTAAEWLRRHPVLSTVLGERAVTLAVCAGLQLLGHARVEPDGGVRRGLGLLDLTTRPASRRQVGEAVSRSTVPGVGYLTGFHNHLGVSLLGASAEPLAHRERGPANHPNHPHDGALTPYRPGPGPAPGIVGTYMHGPVLARNPALADHLITRALGGPLPDLDPERVPDLDDLRRSYLDRYLESHPGRPERRPG